MSIDERRQYPRLDVPILSRPAALRAPPQPARNVSRGGISVHLDEALAVGTRLEIELFLPGDDSLSVDVRVAWIRELAGDHARYEAGLRSEEHTSELQSP